MQVWQMILITVLAFLKKTDHKGPQIAIYNSMFWGGMAGIVMGDFKTGLSIGATFQLMSLGVTSIGGASVPDYQIGAIISTAIAVSTGQGMEAGITIGLPVAIACIQLDVLQNLMDGYLVRRAQIYCSRGEFKRMNRALWLCIPATGLSTAIPAFLAVAFGPSVVNGLMAFLPSWFLPGLSIAGKMLPVCGIAALLLYMPLKKYFEYLLFGFVLSAYLQVPILGVVIVGVGFAYMVYKKKTALEAPLPVEGGKNCAVKAAPEYSGENGPRDAEEASPAFGGLIQTSKRTTNTLNKRDLWQVGFRWNQSLESFNYENQMAGAVVYALSPALRKIYKKDEEYKIALNNHFRFFNVTPYLGNLILGISLAIEDHQGIEAKEGVQSMKVGLMGAITGFGDSIFYVLLPTIFGSIGGYMALYGNPTGMIVWLLYGLVFCILRPHMVALAYKGGYKIMDEFEERIPIFTEAASVLGLTVVGSMITTVVTIKTPLTFISGAVTKELQGVLDGILPSMLPVLLTALVMFLLKKKIRLTRIIFMIIAGSCILTALGILA